MRSGKKVGSGTKSMLKRIMCICCGREGETVPRGPGGLGKLERERTHEASLRQDL